MVAPELRKGWEPGSRIVGTSLGSKAGSVEVNKLPSDTEDKTSFNGICDL